MGARRAGGGALGPRRPFATIVLVVVGLVGLAVAAPGPDPAAARPRPGVPVPAPRAPRANEVAHATLTFDGFDRYRWSGNGPTAVVRTGVLNRGGNLRTVWWPRAQGTGTDQEACITWTAMSVGTSGTAIQPGVALRVRSHDGDVRAITVTNNIFSGNRSAWNVHVWHARRGRPTDYRLIGQARSLPAFASDKRNLPPLPWRVCARVIAATVEFQVWSVGPGLRRPGWGTFGHGAAYALPPGWEAPGHAGWYAGHLARGETVSFEDLTARPVGPHGSGAGLGRTSRGSLASATYQALRAVLDR